MTMSKRIHQKNTDCDDVLLRMEDFSAVSLEGEKISNTNFTLMTGEVHAILASSANDVWGMMHIFQNRIRRSNGVFLVKGQPVERTGNLYQWIQTMTNEPVISRSISVAEQIMLSSKMKLLQAKNNAIADCAALMEQTRIYINLEKPLISMSQEELYKVELLHICALKPPIAVFLDTMTFLTEEGRGDLPLALEWLRKNGCGSIYITVSFEDAMQISDRMSVLDGGTIRKTFSVSSIRKSSDEVREVASLLSGWKNVSQYDSPANNSDRHDAVPNAEKILSSSQELKRILEYQLKDTVKTMGASGAALYILEDGKINVLETGMNLREHLLPIDAICELVDRKGPFYFRVGSKEYANLFTNGDISGGMVFCPMQVQRTKALLQVIFIDRTFEYEDISRRLQIFVKEITIAVETSRLLGNSVLLQESHHRIKNNLQMVVNLLYLQKAEGITLTQKHINAILETAINRIKCIAYVHSLLCRDWYGKNIVNLRQIIGEIVRLYEASGVTIHVTLEDITLPYNTAVNMALVINELVSNCIKHAFPKGEASNEIGRASCRERV